MDERKWASFLELFDSTDRIAVLTGAGISTLSGIPDFRSIDGYYSKKHGRIPIEEMLDIDYFRKYPDEFYSWAKDTWYTLHLAPVSIIHRVLVKMEEKGKLGCGLFTQNIDGLHTRAGQKRTGELHGTINSASCTECGESFSYDSVRSIVSSGAVPVCSRCGSLVKPDIVFYGEGLPSDCLMEAELAFRKADIAIVLGSSLVVQPAASLPYSTLRNGGKVVVVNRDSTYLDRNAITFPDLREWGERMEKHLDEI